MSADPAEPDTFQDQFAETLDPEAPEADASEQQKDLSPQEDDPLTGHERGEATEGDAAEQARIVELDDEDYR